MIPCAPTPPRSSKSMTRPRSTVLLLRILTAAPVIAWRILRHVDVIYITAIAQLKRVAQKDVTEPLNTGNQAQFLKRMEVVASIRC